MTDISHTIEPKSDQLNADDLISGPRTIRIREVRVHGAGRDDQPVSVFYEGDNNKPWKPCKSMRRVLVRAWGRDSNNYAGKSVTLFNDPNVLWAGQKVGGIRISHMSDIDGSFQMALTESKSKRKPFKVAVLTQDNAPPAQEDRVLKGANSLIDQINQSTDPTALSADPKVVEQRDYLEQNRPELAEKVTKAFEHRGQQLRNDDATPPPPPPPPPASDPFGDDDDYVGA